MKSGFRLTLRSALAVGAVLVAAGIGAFVVLDLVFADRMTPTRASQLLEKSSPELVAVLKDEFKADFSRIVKATIESETQLTAGEEMAHFLDAQTRPIAERLADSARQAPPNLVADWMTKRAESMDAVAEVAGPETCAKYVESGTAALTDSSMLSKLTPVFDARDAAYFAALAGARDTPSAELITEATDEDWEAVGAAMNGLEVPAGYAQIVVNDDTGNTDYCAALAYYFRTIAALPGDGGARIRAEYFVRSLS